MSQLPSASAARHTVAQSRHESTALMMPTDENVRGHVFGGAILAMLDKTAAVAAMRHSRQPCVTVSVDRVDFREAIMVGELVIMKASVNWVGRTSMEVGVRVEAENILTGVRRHTHSCYTTFVAIDEAGRPSPVPPLELETEDDRRRHAAATARRQRRLEERKTERRSP
ncbi:MAG: acyl-CoA thioesterase [Gemmatimonadetes bacterium]|nr:acyl-CoA thioesterase [Gemmatimonadota bacterium]